MKSKISICFLTIVVILLALVIIEKSIRKEQQTRLR